MIVFEAQFSIDVGMDETLAEDRTEPKSKLDETNLYPKNRNKEEKEIKGED